MLCLPKLQPRQRKINRIVLRIAAVLIAICLLTLSGTVIQSVYVRAKYVTSDFSSLQLDGVENLMIVAHPDDDVLWGGAHLLEERYLVVCITAGANETRAKEFTAAMKKTGDIGIMLGFPNKTLGKRNDWKSSRAKIKQELTEIMQLKSWKSIVTHNPEGEYGHIHHKMTSSIVTEIYEELYPGQSNLYYFGAYYSKDKIGAVENSLTRISDDLLAQKKDILLGVYTSQDFLERKFSQMFPYENWTQYTAPSA